MPVKKRTILGVVLAVLTLLSFLITITMWVGIFGTEHMFEWEGEDESVIVFFIRLSIYYLAVSALGFVGLISYFAEGKIWKFIIKFLAINCFIVIIFFSICLILTKSLLGLIGLVIIGLLIWGLYKFWRISKIL